MGPRVQVEPADEDIPHEAWKNPRYMVWMGQLWNHVFAKRKDTPLRTDVVRPDDDWYAEQEKMEEYRRDFN